MSKKKEKLILSDKIAELIAPRRLLDPEIDSEDETTARVHDYDINDEEIDDFQAQLSDIRKKNVKLLHDVDAKYRGKVMSRKDFENDSSDNEAIEDDDNDDIDEIENDEPENEDCDAEKNKSIGAFSMMLTPKQKMELGEDTNESEINGAKSNERDDESEIRTFSTKFYNSAGKSNVNGAESDDDLDLASDSGEKLEKWDDDYEGEDIESELDADEHASDVFDENDDDNSFEEEVDKENDEEEIDFGGGHIVPNASNDVETDISILPKKQSDDHLQKGACVQNQLQVWEKLLEVRIHSQKMLIKANSLPNYAKYQRLVDKSKDFSELAADAEMNVLNLLSRMRELQWALVKQYPQTKILAAKRKQKAAKSNLSDLEPDAKRNRIASELDQDYSTLKEYQYSVISKWHDRTKVLTPGSIKSQQQHGNVDILRKIEGVLANRDDLIKKSQLHKGSYQLFDQIELEQNAGEIKQANGIVINDEDHGASNVPLSDSNHVYCAEIYDDTDFYHTQLRELIEYKTDASGNANEMAKQFAELQKLRKKMKKTVDTRASKGRKIRYVVHNKLLSFMAPNETCGDWTDEAKTELYRSLFGAQV